MLTQSQQIQFPKTRINKINSKQQKNSRNPQIINEIIDKKQKAMATLLYLIFVNKLLKLKQYAYNIQETNNKTGQACMSINTCSITGQPLSHPVISKLTGYLYEKQAIEKHLSTFPYCPVTNQPMQLSDLLDLATSSFGSGPSSIAPLQKPSQSPKPYLIKLQQQYDTIILQNHYLRQSLKETKQQILHCAYQNEAATRLIGKLLKQKQDTEREIQSLKQQVGQAYQ